VKAINRFVLAIAGLSLSGNVWAATPDSANPLWYLGGESTSVKNDDGALVVGYRAGRTADTFVHFAGRTPIVWARYNPGQAIGHILITRAVRLPDGTTQVRATTFRPGDGSRIASGGAGRRLAYFGGINPFAQFDSASDDYFRGVNFTAFLASVGVVMRSAAASVAFVYYPALVPMQTISGSGNELAWSANGTAVYSMEGRWLLGLQAEAGDQRGLVPAYRVMGCNPAIDARNGCVVKGFASFVSWDRGNLPSAPVSLVTRAGAGIPDLGAVAAVFTGLEGYLRDASLWSDAAWSSIAGVSSSNSVYAMQSSKIGEGDLGRRDRLAEVNPEMPGQLGGSITYGVVVPGSPTFWNPSDLATAEFVTKTLGQVGGGLGAASTAADWQMVRDRAASQDMRVHQGTTPAVRVINGTH
jgi:hypothetical protein